MANNKFGMFIHWGLYALTEIQDQAFVRFDMDRAEYESLAKKFDPVKYDPEKWVLLAKSAGMKYICFTTKHHDGFCMWDTKYTDYNVMNTPYGKDVLKMLSDACRKHGMLLSLYYSNPDWHHHYGFNPQSSHQWRSVQRDDVDTLRYREYIRDQITELLTNYGPIYTLYWDIPPKIEDPSLNELARKLQPDILINDRGWSKGDFSTPEREYKALGDAPFARMTEACNSVDQQSWGYRADPDFYSLRHLTCAIHRIMCLGGSYLLNVGPSAQGEITENYAERIRLIGDWYNRMENCLEDVEADPFNYESRGSKCVATKKGNKTYLHFYDGVISSAVNLRKYPTCPKSVRLLNNGKQLEFKIEYLPEYYNGNSGMCIDKYLHITGIPADELSSEPVVLEITW
ncbi:MAG: glycoside hydrolase [Ruminococcaceae bacterium]|nr:glycoside hydrolase [Oscillospiraceae bacterium]